MAISRNILLRAATVLQDTENTRWPLRELAEWANDGMRAIVIAKPSATAANKLFQLQAGTRQDLFSIAPPEPYALLDVPRNVKAGSTEGAMVGARTIRRAERRHLDTNYPDWHDGDLVPFTDIVKHFIVDEQNPRSFFVFPGNTGAGLAEIVVSLAPGKFTYTGNESLIANYTPSVPELLDVYETPLLDYILFRAYSKDDLAANAGKAQWHYQQFAQAVGIKIQAEAATSANATKG